MGTSIMADRRFVVAEERTLRFYDEVEESGHFSEMTGLPLYVALDKLTGIGILLAGEGTKDSPYEFDFTSREYVERNLNFVNRKASHEGAPVYYYHEGRLMCVTGINDMEA